MSGVTTRLLAFLAYAARKGKGIAARPSEGVPYVFERVTEWRHWHRQTWPYEVTEECEERVHELIGADWPCDEGDGFEAVWDAALDDLAARGLQVGRGTFSRWDDGDRRLGRVAWCVARHGRPASVVETGVARGLTTRVLLEALERNASGRLWSIDLPPFEDGLAQEIAAAVPEQLHQRWTLLRGSSRRLLPGIVADLGQIDLFLHDSRHTTQNVRFELEQVWPALTPGGAACIDDVEKNVATGQFLQAHPEAQAVISPSDDRQALIGCVVKPRPSDV